MNNKLTKHFMQHLFLHLNKILKPFKEFKNNQQKDIKVNLIIKTLVINKVVR